MRITGTTFSVLVAFAIVGCADEEKNTVDYQENPAIVVANEVIVDRAFEDVWNGLVRQLAKGFFVVNNIEKESRFINVSFTSTNPEQYIDCGTTRRTFSQGKENLTYEYEVAADSSFKYGEGIDQTGTIAFISYVDRGTSLDGRMNVYIAPVGDRTEVTVNVRYILTIKVTGQRTNEDSIGNIVNNNPIPAEINTISFNTNQPNRDADGISCFSKGVLEAEILSMAQPN